MSSTERIRNVALVGHSGAGKTSLVEAMALRAGLISRLGRIEDGSTVSDTEPEEVAHHISLSLAVVPIDWKGYRLNVIDTPGDPDFAGEVRAALGVADVAVVVVSGVDGVQVGTEQVWRMCEDMGLPRMVFVNKLDRERSSFDRTLAELRERYGSAIEPLELPIGDESSFYGVADVLTETAYVYDSGQAVQTEVPPELAEREHATHDEVVEAIVSGGDDALLERFLEGEEPSLAELERTLMHELVRLEAFPVLEGASTVPIGVDRLCDYLCEIAPSPADRPGAPVSAGDVTVDVTPDPDGDPLAVVFKTIADPYVGHLSLFKVLSGTIRNDDHLVNSRTGADERLHGVFRPRGSRQEPVAELVAGDLGGVAKLNDTETGDTLAPRSRPVEVRTPPRPDPLHTVAVRPRTQADDDKLASSIARLRQEDPTLVLDHDEDTHQTLLRGTGEMHLSVTLERLARKFGVHVDVEPVRVAYRETITSTASAEGRYKKQSGGHGQFGVVALTLEPTERGTGFAFVDEVVGGAIPRQFIPAVERGILDAMAEGGVVKGYPVVDVRARCTDGKAHSVDSSEMSFRAAGRLAFREAMALAAPVLLEPLADLVVVVPTALQGDVMGDVSARRGRVSGAEPVGSDEVAISAVVPTSEMTRYAVELRSLTAARGRFSVRHAGYDVMPSHLVDLVEARA
ncbi:MAG: elongation factor G [Acidimicrobiales bacterium]